jgi:hypothetical protein
MGVVEELLGRRVYVDVGNAKCRDDLEDRRALVG